MKKSSLKPFSFHPRNKHQGHYNFLQLADCCPSLQPYLITKQDQQISIDFSNPSAVKILNEALLRSFYHLNSWSVPEGYLCPPIPGRSDYIHYLADLLQESGFSLTTSRSPPILGLDIGVGASCIYPLIGWCEYGWHFVGSDISSLAIEHAQRILRENQQLSQFIHLRLQESTSILANLLKPKDRFDFTICNPPFYSSLKEAQQENKQKWKGLNTNNRLSISNSHFNFGGSNQELFCEKGELGFLNQMIKESCLISKKIFWFTSLVSKSEHLKRLTSTLQGMKVFDFKIIEMAQGQKKSRILAWTFLNDYEQQKWIEQ
jgi:23S rRNA (adenine1618-N6)-methyltransferase